MTIPSYTQPTASMPADTGACPLPEDTAPVSFLRSFPFDSALCAGSPPDWEWVPTRESSVVPTGMSALCQTCPGRQACLLWALAADEPGYWAATTSRDREQLRELGQTSVQTADWLQQIAAGQPLHRPGEGSYRWYRSHCRCQDCRAANTARRAAERSKARCQVSA